VTQYAATYDITWPAAAPGVKADVVTSTRGRKRQKGDDNDMGRIRVRALNSSVAPT
jgi:hypothetical protein